MGLGNETAAMCLARGVRILNQDGMEYTEDSNEAFRLALELLIHAAAQREVAHP